MAPLTINSLLLLAVSAAGSALAQGGPISSFVTSTSAFLPSSTSGSSGASSSGSGSGSGSNTSGGVQTSVFLPVGSALAGVSISTRVPVSAVAADQSATTFAVACSAFAGSGALSSALCQGGLESLTFTAGPSTMEATLQVVTGGVTPTIAQSCVLQSNTIAACTSKIVVGSGALKITTTSTQTYTGTPTLAYVPVQITAGASNLEGASTRAPSSSTSSSNPNAAMGLTQGARGLGWVGGAVVGLLGFLV